MGNGSAFALTQTLPAFSNYSETKSAINNSLRYQAFVNSKGFKSRKEAEIARLYVMQQGHTPIPRRREILDKQRRFMRDIQSTNRMIEQTLSNEYLLSQT